MDPSAVSARAQYAFRWFACVLMVLIWTNCTPSPPPPPPPPVATFQEIQTDIGRAGRLVAVTVSAADKQIAIAAGDGGGLFRTADGGNSWQHIDSFPPFHMVDVAFAEPGASSTQIVLATTMKDAQLSATANFGGIWRSADAGLSWTHIALPASCPPPQSAHGIAYLGANAVFVAADCGLLTSSDLGNTWTKIFSAAVRSVVAQAAGGSTLLDVCLQGGGHSRSINAGGAWSAVHGGPTCETAHALAPSPLESAVLFATFDAGKGLGLRESDDGGQTWSTDLQATAYNERPVWVRTRRAPDGNAAHFDLYFPGRRVTCSNSAAGPRCPSNAGETWLRVPASPLNHDLNGLAFDPSGNCPLLMAADFGVYRAASAPPPCGDDAGWTQVGKASSGLGSLQIYQVTGQLHYPITGSGIFISGFTNLFLGTMDNLLWVTHDAGGMGWQGFGTEGSYLQTIYQAPIAPAADLQLTYMEFGSGGTAMKTIPNLQSATWSAASQWTSATPPGTATAPVLISAHTYVQWSGTTLFLTVDGGSTWSTLGTLPTIPTGPLQINKFGSSQVTRTPAGPAMYEYVTDATGKIGLALITNLSPTPTPRVLELATLGGVNNRGFGSGLQGIHGNCFAPRGWYCQPVYAADPNDYRKLIAADPVQHIMASSADAAQTWQSIVGLTNLVTAGGTLSFTDATATGGCQAHVIAYDPGNSAHVLVGTDQAGLIASANGGTTWSALPGTTKAPGISSIFFDDRANVVYVATYGRGLWKLTLDWSTLP